MIQQTDNNYNKKNITVGFISLGCKVNQYEIEALAEMFEKQGYIREDSNSLCDVYIINTCTVTAESDRKSRQLIRRALLKNPSAYILVTGCLAQIGARSIAQIDGVDVICGNAEKSLIIKETELLIKNGVKNTSPKIVMPNIDSASFEPMSITRFDRTRAYIKIEDGCESNCTYCIIPSARGKIRSKPKNEVIDEIKCLYHNGCREIVLTGIETASYGIDLENTSLADLLLEIDNMHSVDRIRLGSLDVSLMKPKFIDKIADLKYLTPHFHLSMQSGSDKILALMKRKYNTKMAFDGIEYLRKKIPDVQLTTDIIVGFPNESEEDFIQTAEFMKRVKFLSAHIFPYSKRAGTPAADMEGQISQHIKQERVSALISLQKEIRKSLLSELTEQQNTYDVLFEHYDKKSKTAFGHTPSFIEVAVKNESNLHGMIEKVKIISYDEIQDICIGEII